MFTNLDDVQKMSKVSTDATMKSFGAITKGAQVIATEVTEYLKRSFENGAKAMEKLAGVKSLDKAIEVQSEYAKATCEGYAAQATKLGEIYADLAKEAFKPYEAFVANATPAK
jgi:hypothetical protein